MSWWVWLIIGVGSIFVGFIMWHGIGFWKFWKSIEDNDMNNMCIRR